MKKTQKKNPFTRRPTDIQSSFWRLGGAGSAMELTAPQHEEKLFVIFVCCSVVFSHVIFYRRIFCSLSYLRSFLIFFLYICSMRAANVCISLNNFIYSRNRNSWSFYVSVGRCCCSAAALVARGTIFGICRKMLHKTLFVISVFGQERQGGTLNTTK